MSIRAASYTEGLSFRQILAFDIFRWNMRLGFAIAPRDMRDLRRRKRPRLRPPDVPSHLRRDIGLPPEPTSYHDLALHHLLRSF